jgi:hypothetical protein
MLLEEEANTPMTAADSMMPIILSFELFKGEVHALVGENVFLYPPFERVSLSSFSPHLFVPSFVKLSNFYSMVIQKESKKDVFSTFFCPIVLP